MTDHDGAGAVLFDLDGTLLDTAPDMVATLDLVMGEESRPPLAYEHARNHVSNGVLGLLRLAFGELEDGERNRLRQRFLQLYAERLALATRLFPGMDAVLDRLDASGVPWGVVTNKPAAFTEPLLDRLLLLQRCACVVSGDTLPQRKPDPAPLLHALRQIGVTPAAAIYVGDAARDIAAGRAAGMRTVAALYGYIPHEENASIWGADHHIRHPSELFAILNGAYSDTAQPVGWRSR